MMHQLSSRPHHLDLAMQPLDAHDDAATSAGHSPLTEASFSPAESTADLSEQDKSVSVVNAMTNNLVIHLRSRIAKAAMEQDSLNDQLDGLHSKITFLERKKKEQLAKSDHECLALQAELNQTRLREADLTLAFEELKHQIELINGVIQSEPLLLEFFNSVMNDPLPQKLCSVGVNTSPKHDKSKFIFDERIDVNRYLTEETHLSSTNPFLQMTEKVNDAEAPMDEGVKNFTKDQLTLAASQHNKGHGSGGASPISDSGCSFTSHLLDELTTANTSIAEDISIGSGKVQPRPRNSISDRKPENHLDTVSHLRRTRKPVGRYTEDVFLQQETPFHRDQYYRALKTTSMYEPQMERYLSPHEYEEMMDGEVPLRRQSAAHETTPNSAGGKTPTVEQAQCYIPSQMNPHSTQGRLQPKNGGSVGAVRNSIQTESKAAHAFSRVRSSVRNSLQWITHSNSNSRNVDYKLEAMAAYQGEARALMQLRTTQLELRRSEARCQKLQRYINEQEDMLNEKEKDLEVAAANERKLHQELRALKRKISFLEEDHREYRVTQGIREMELASQLAETSIRLTHTDTLKQHMHTVDQINAATENLKNMPGLSPLSETPVLGLQPRTLSSMALNIPATHLTQHPEMTLSIPLTVIGHAKSFHDLSETSGSKLEASAKEDNTLNTMTVIERKPENLEVELNSPTKSEKALGSLSDLRIDTSALV